MTTDSILERALSGALDPQEDPEETAALAVVLDAAYDLFSLHGVQRTTMDDIARRAGLSRITVYRRVASKEALVEQVVLRELRRYFDQFLLDVAPARTMADRVVAGFVSSLRAVRGNPLIGGLMRTEPTMMLPSLLGTEGRTQLVVAQFLAGQLGRAQAAGAVEASVDVDAVAELMVRVATSFVLAPTSGLDLDDEAALADYARLYLAPLLDPPHLRIR